MPEAQRLTFVLNEAGMLASVRNEQGRPQDGGAPDESVGAASTGLSLASWGWSFDVGGIDHAHRPTTGGPSCMTAGDQPGTWQGPLADVAWAFDQPADGIIRTRWTVTNTSDATQTVGHILVADWLLGQRFQELFDYRTSGDVAFAAIGRGATSSVLVVSENPFVSFDLGDVRLRVTTRANLRLRPGEVLHGEPIYVMVVPERAGTVVGRCLPKADGSLPDRGGLPNPRNRVLDDAEVAALRNLMAWRIPRRRPDNAMLDLDWVNALHPEVAPSPNQTAPQDVAAMLAKHRGLMDEMAELGVGRIIIDQALAREPDRGIPDKAGWEVDHRAQPILEDAHQRGLRIGLYNGCGNWPSTWPGMYSASIDFPLDDPAWKIQDANGAGIVAKAPGHPILAPEPGTRSVNCLAHRPFRDWFIDVVSATIDRHGLQWWGWDVDDAWQFTIGSCFATGHDHGPGDTSYSLWRAMHEVEGELRRRHPDLVIMNYWGRKAVGSFGLTECDVNENSCEYLSVWPEGGQIAQMMGGDATWRFGWWDTTLAWPSANDLRLQFWVNAVDRFLPNHLGYGPFNGELVELIGAIAAGALIAVYDSVPVALRPTVAAWLRFFDAEQDLLGRGHPAWGPPRRAGVDGWWHEEAGRALAFLFNPNAMPLTVEVPDIARGAGTAVRERSPEAGPWLALDGVVEHRGPITVEVPAASWLVLEVMASIGRDLADTTAHPAGGDAQPFAWSPAVLAAHEASLPAFPLDLASSNMTRTSLYPAGGSSGARTL